MLKWFSKIVITFWMVSPWMAKGIHRIPTIFKILISILVGWSICSMHCCHLHQNYLWPVALKHELSYSSLLHWLFCLILPKYSTLASNICGSDIHPIKPSTATNFFSRKVPLLIFDIIPFLTTVAFWSSQSSREIGFSGHVAISNRRNIFACFKRRFSLTSKCTLLKSGKVFLARISIFSIFRPDTGEWRKQVNYELWKPCDP